MIKLAENNIKNLDDLGDLSSHELVEMFDTKKLKKKDADEIIMKARENWFKEEKTEKKEEKTEKKDTKKKDTKKKDAKKKEDKKKKLKTIKK